MAIIPRLREFLYGTQARPRSKVESGDQQPYDFWNKDRNKGRDFKHMKELGDIYRRGGPVSQAIRTKANFVFSNGYRIEGESEELNQLVEDKLNELELEIVGPQALIDALAYGDCFHELARGQGEANDKILAQVPRSPETFRIDHDEYGVINGYTQVLNRDQPLSEVVEIPFKTSEIFHFTIENLGGAVYGTSLIDQAWNDIHWDVEIAKSTAEAIKRHGYPRFHIKVGLEGETVDDDIMRKIDTQFRNLNSKQEFVTTRDLDITNIDQVGQNNTKAYGEWSTMRLCTALGIPEELLGLGRGSTEATANVKLRAFYDDISALQRRFARAYTKQVIDQLTPRPGMVKLIFNEVNPKDQAAIASWLAMMFGATSVDPFAVVPRKYAQDLLGITESDWDEDDYIMGKDQDEEDLNPIVESSADELDKEDKDRGFSSEAACKAAKTKGQAPGPGCGGSVAKGTSSRTEQPQESIVPLPKEVRAQVEVLRKERAKLGKPAHNHRLGKAGEVVAQSLMEGFKAHECWNDADDLCNGYLMDVKTLNPNSEGTPIYANKIKRKLARSDETGKRWKFPLLHVQEDRINVYMNTPPEEFYTGELDYYMANISESELIGYVDSEGVWHKEGKA